MIDHHQFLYKYWTTWEVFAFFERVACISLLMKQYLKIFGEDKEITPNNEKLLRNYGIGIMEIVHQYCPASQEWQWCRVLLAHLSRRLMGELIVYQSLPCPSVRRSTFSNTFSSETTGPIKLKGLGSRRGEIGPAIEMHTDLKYVYMVYFIEKNRNFIFLVLKLWKLWVSKDKDPL